MSVLLVRGGREYVCRPGAELQTDLGVLRVPEDVAPGDTVATHLGEEFRVRRLRCLDLFNHLERTGAPMLPRDVGLVLGLLGIEAGDRVLDAGTGTGVLAAWLGRIGARVTSVERDEGFAEVARENMRVAGVGDRVEVRAGDVLEEAGAVGMVDVVTLDLGDAPGVVRVVADAVVAGGMLGVYSPFVEDARGVAAAARDAGFGGVETVETIQRRMDFDARGSRPSTGPVGHSGYLTTARKP